MRTVAVGGNGELGAAADVLALSGGQVVGGVDASKDADRVGGPRGQRGVAAGNVDLQAARPALSVRPQACDGSLMAVIKMPNGAQDRSIDQSHGFSTSGGETPC